MMGEIGEKSNCLTVERLDWGMLDADDYWLPPGLLSLHGVAGFAELPEAMRKRLSRHEFMNQIAVGLWLESLFIARLGRIVARDPLAAGNAGLLAIVREEAGHSQVFLRLQAESGLSPAWRPPRLVDWLARHAPADSALFWLAVYLAETIPQRCNRRIRHHPDAINPLVRHIVSLHAADEARHIAHARRMLRRKLDKMPSWRKRPLAIVARLLISRLLSACCRPAPHVYERAGLVLGATWHERAARDPEQRRRLAACAAPALAFLRRQGVFMRADKALL